MLRWQLKAIKDGLANYAEGDAYKLKEVAYYLAAYARKLERIGYGYAAATNAYCAISLLKKSASRGCDEARAACYCCFGFGGFLGRHGAAVWSGLPQCYSFHMHDVPITALRGFEPPPDYFVGEFHGRRRYVRVYDRDMKLAEECKDKVEPRLMSWHTSRTQDCVGWWEPSELVEIVHIDFASLDVQAHVEKLVKEMESEIAEVDARSREARDKEIEERKRKYEEKAQRRLRIYEQKMRENEERRRRKKEQVDESAFVAFDNDGDGLVNTVDPEPDVAGPDAHGTNAEWYNTVCSNVVTAVNGTNGVVLTWHEGVNTNAYYFVDMVTDKGPVPVYFTGDRTSNLGNPAVVAHAGETNHVPLLIGVSYAVTSGAPFSVSVSSNYKKYVVMERVSPCIVRICWPLRFEFVESVSNGKRSYTVKVLPYDPGGTFTWRPTPCSGPLSDTKPIQNGETKKEETNCSALEFQKTRGKEEPSKGKTANENKNSEAK